MNDIVFAIICFLAILYFVVFCVSYVTLYKDLQENHAPLWKKLVYPFIFSLFYTFVVVLFTPMLVILFPFWVCREFYAICEENMKNS